MKQDLVDLAEQMRLIELNADIDRKLALRRWLRQNDYARIYPKRRRG